MIARRLLVQFSLFKYWHDKLLNKTPCKGKYCQFFPHRRPNKTCQGKRARQYGTLDVKIFNLFFEFQGATGEPGKEGAGGNRVCILLIKIVNE